MSRLWQGVKIQYLYAKPGFTVFWGIILGIMVVQYLGFFYFFPMGNVEVKSVAGGHIVAVIIYMGIATGMQCWETLPYALNLGNTRREFWLGCAVFNCLYALVMAAILVGLSLLELAAYAALGLEHQWMGEAGARQVFTHLMVDFAVIAAVVAGVFLAVMLGYRFGWKPFLIMAAGIISSFKLFPAWGQALGKLIGYSILVTFGRGTPWPFIGWMCVLTAICYLLAYPLVRGSQVKS
ncbi:MAG TPA: hypothetical protein GXX34_11885 [Clostridia bacterium]|nr:hypothetical protein [Clostridia bacterium]